MKLISIFLLLLSSLSLGGIIEYEGPDCFDIYSDTTVIYQYDEFTAGGADEVTVGDLIALHKFYLTDSSMVFLTVVDGEEVNMEEVLHPGNKETLKQVLKTFRRITNGNRAHLVYSQWEFIGFDIDGSLYAIEELNTDASFVTPYIRGPTLSIPLNNSYIISNIRGQIVHIGTDYRVGFDLNSTPLASGVYFMRVMDIRTDYDVTFSITVR